MNRTPPPPSGPPRSERWLVAGVPAVMVLALLAPGLRPGGIVFGWDTVGEHYAWESWVWDRYASGRGALWNSHVSCGFPFPAQGTTGVFYPLAFAHLFLSHGTASDVVLALHLWLLAAGCAAFVRSVGGAVAGALVAAAASLVAAPVVGSVLLGGRAQTFALAWLPWMLVATERALARGAPAWFGIGGGIGGLALLAGQPFAAIQGLVGSLGYALLRGGGLPAARRLGRRAAAVGWLGMVAVAALVAAPQLAAWIEYRPLAGGQGQLPAMLEDLGALPWRQLVTLFFPGFFGDEATTPYWGHFLLSMVSPYLGWAVLALAPAAVLGRFAAAAKPLAWIGCGAFALAMGGHVPVVHALWSALPGAAAFHFPARWLGLFAITASIGAGLGAAHLIGAPAGDRAWRRTVFVALALLGMASLLALATTAGSRDGVAPGWLWIFRAALADPLRATATQDAPPEAWMANAHAASRFALLRGLAVGGVVAAVVVAARRSPPRVRATALVAAVAADGGSWASRYVSHVEPRALELPARVVDRIRREGAHDRYATTLAPADTPGPRQLVRHFAGLDQYAQRPMHAGMLAGLDALQWGSYGLEAVHRAINDGTIFAQRFPSDRRWLDFLGVRWLIAPAGVSGAGDLDGLRLSVESSGFEALRQVEEGADFTLFENPHAQPRAQLIREPIVVPNETALAARLIDPGFDPATQVVVLARDLGPRHAGSGALEGTAQESVVEWRAHDDGHLVLRARSPAPSLLVVAESWYPGWRVSVDGREAKPVAVDGAFLGVEVPPGDVEVAFRYRPVWLWPALCLSCVGSAVALAAAAATARSLRSRPGHPTESHCLAVAESP